MSGIFGYVNRHTGQSVREICERMGARMCHTPYQVMQIATPAEHVGIGRLGIGIFNRSPQPVGGESGVWVWLCGEFYHQQARRAALISDGAISGEADDAELALAVYLREGAAGLTRLEGAFLIAVWDGRCNELLLVNDRYGLYPHYYARIGDAFALAPEIKAVLCAPGVPRRLNMPALAEYLRFQQLLGDKTWFEDVRLLPPAVLARFRPADGDLRITRYWDWNQIGSLPAITLNEAADECSRLFRRAIDSMAEPGHRTGVYLSGGLDSRTILGYIDRQTPVTTITYGEAGCRDVVYAAELARRSGSDHHWFPFQDGSWVLEHAPRHLALTEGGHSWMHAHGMSTLDEARTLIDVNLSGWDGGTIVGGLVDAYPLDFSLRHAPSEADLAQRLYESFCYRLTWPGMTEPESLALLSTADSVRLRGLAFDSFRSELARTAHFKSDYRTDFFFLEQHVLRSTINMAVFARSSIEVRSPYFDYDFLSFIYSLPEPIRTTPALRRLLLTRGASHLATVPYEADNRLPHSNSLLYHTYATLQRAKHWVHRRIPPIFPSRPRLYADYEKYLRTDLRPWAEEILFEPRTIARDLFDPAAVQSLWDRHLSGNELWTIGKIAPLMTIELVLRHL